MKFEIGEICEVMIEGWMECEILPLTPDIDPKDDYHIHIPGYPSWWKDGSWAVRENQLRKKRPKEEPAEEWFTEWLKSTAEDKISVPLKA